MASCLCAVQTDDVSGSQAKSAYEVNTSILSSTSLALVVAYTCAVSKSSPSSNSVIRNFERELDTK